MHLVGKVWRHRGDAGEQVVNRLVPRRGASNGAASIREEGVGELHEFGDGGVESEGFDVGAHAAERLVCGATHRRFTCGLVLACGEHARVRIARLFAVWVECECPDAAKEAHHAADAARRPGAALIPRTHEHQEEAHRVGAVSVDEFVGVLHVAARLRHALAVGTKDLPLVEEARERL